MQRSWLPAVCLVLTLLLPSAAFAGFSGYAGSSIGVLELDLSELNEHLGKIDLTLPERTVYYGGFGHTGFVPGFSLGGTGFKSEFTARNDTHSCSLTLDGSGVTGEQALSLFGSRFDLVFGLSAGAGNAGLDIFLADNVDSVEELVTSPSLNRATASFIFAKPYTGLCVRVLPFLKIGIEGGYSGFFLHDWQVYGGGQLNGMPDLLYGPYLGVYAAFGFQFSSDGQKEDRPETVDGIQKDEAQDGDTKTESLPEGQLGESDSKFDRIKGIDISIEFRRDQEIEEAEEPGAEETEPAPEESI